MNIPTILTATSLLAGLLAPELRGEAYLDPGSGSFILQLIVAGALGSALAIKAYWSKIVAIFRKSDSEQEDDQEGIDANEQ